MQHLKQYFLVYTLVPLVIFSLSASYYRFMVSYDYEVTYGGYCDPYIDQCFVNCEDEECLEPLYYTMVSRSAASLLNLCSDTLVSECELAQFCQPNEQSCSVTFCTVDSEIPCEDLNIVDMTPNSEQTKETLVNDRNI